ncbi:MAG TPA: alpha/beta hydrolase [Solirubrobacteraceae bacterium]|jgi:pimeloyl-ACP methyl ester carboxylesterase|nr:alpha/beta hydrolase [Solirubrobacteraceae bacterium]
MDQVVEVGHAEIFSDDHDDAAHAAQDVAGARRSALALGARRSALGERDNGSVSGIEQWWSEGETVSVPLAGVDRQVFVRRAGGGPHVTLLHGFPSSSYDWAAVARGMAAQRSLLMADLLGFGASEKPLEHTYSLHEQADLVEALWSIEGVRETTIVAHDYSVSVAQELLARRAEGALAVTLHGVHLLNGAVYPDLHRQQPAQTALLDPEQGPALSAMINERLFIVSLAPTFAPDYDAAADSAEIWAATHRSDGERISHLLIGYVRDREEHSARWIAALEGTDVPLAFVWGMLDPVSGAHMAERIRERLPAVPLRALADVGHWPSLEAPQEVVRAVLGS